MMSPKRKKTGRATGADASATEEQPKDKAPAANAQRSGTPTARAPSATAEMPTPKKGHRPEEEETPGKPGRRARPSTVDDETSRPSTEERRRTDEPTDGGLPNFFPHPVVNAKPYLRFGDAQPPRLAEEPQLISTRKLLVYFDGARRNNGSTASAATTTTEGRRGSAAAPSMAAAAPPANDETARAGDGEETQLTPAHDKQRNKAAIGVTLSNPTTGEWYAGWGARLPDRMRLAPEDTGTEKTKTIASSAGNNRAEVIAATDAATVTTQLKRAGAKFVHVVMIGDSMFALSMARRTMPEEEEEEEEEKVVQEPTTATATTTKTARRHQRMVASTTQHQTTKQGHQLAPTAGIPPTSTTIKAATRTKKAKKYRPRVRRPVKNKNKNRSREQHKKQQQGETKNKNHGSTLCLQHPSPSPSGASPRGPHPCVCTPVNRGGWRT
jgi:hypothetical protein